MSILETLKQIEDKRSRRGRIYPLHGILAMLLLAAMHGERSLLAGSAGGLDHLLPSNMRMPERRLGRRCKSGTGGWKSAGCGLCRVQRICKPILPRNWGGRGCSGVGGSPADGNAWGGRPQGPWNSRCG